MNTSIQQAIDRIRRKLQPDVLVMPGVPLSPVEIVIKEELTRVAQEAVSETKARIIKKLNSMKYVKGTEELEIYTVNPIILEIEHLVSEKGIQEK